MGTPVGWGVWVVAAPVMGPSWAIGSGGLNVVCDANQKIDAFAFDVMANVPWWAACRADKHEGLSVGGMTIRSQRRHNCIDASQWNAIRVTSRCNFTRKNVSIPCMRNHNTRRKWLHSLKCTSCWSIVPTSFRRRISDIHSCLVSRTPHWDR